MKITVTLQVDECTSISTTRECNGYTAQDAEQAARRALAVVINQGHIWNAFRRPDLKGMFGACCHRCEHKNHKGLCGQKLYTTDESATYYCTCEGQ